MNEKKREQTLKNISLRSGLGLFHEAIASQKKTKSLTTPAGFRLIKWHTPLNAESFSSLSRIDLSEEHLKMEMIEEKIDWKSVRKWLIYQTRIKEFR